MAASNRRVPPAEAMGMDAWAEAATENRVWVPGSATAGVRVNVCGPGYHQGPLCYPWSGLPPEITSLAVPALCLAGLAPQGGMGGPVPPLTRAA